MVDSKLFRIPWYFRVVNVLGEAAGATRLTAFRLDPAHLMDVAGEKTGLSDFGDVGFREGLEVFVESLRRDADLTVVGRIGLWGMIVTLLSNRLWIRQARIREPHRFQASLDPPVVITGQPRSGTTFLHRLLAEDRRFRTLPFWRLFKPISPESEDAVRREVDRTLWLRRRMTPRLDRKHFVRSDSAEECIWLMNTSFESLGLWVAAPVYGYLEWLGRRDQRAAYREYAALLRYFQTEQPERRLLLKAPSHSGTLDVLEETLPGVRIIQLHRDPAEVCGSLCSLFASLHSAVTRRLDLTRLGRTTIELLGREMKRNLEARRRLSGPVLDIHYRDLVADPVSIVGQVYGFLGWDWSSGAKQTIARYVRNHPQGRHGRHHYELSTFGLSKQDVARVFAPYRRALS